MGNTPDCVAEWLDTLEDFIEDATKSSEAVEERARKYNLRGRRRALTEFVNELCNMCPTLADELSRRVDKELGERKVL